jgi:hypothetical protein
VGLGLRALPRRSQFSMSQRRLSNMKRRNFLATATCLTAGVATPIAALAQQENNARPARGERREYYEIQTDRKSVV